MKKGKRLKLEAKCSSRQLTFYFDTCEITQELSGTENSRYKKKEQLVSENTKDSIPERKRLNQPLCLMERKIIYKMMKKAHSCGEIAKFLGRGKNSIVVEVRRNGGRDAYDPVIAEQQARERTVRRIKKSSETTKGKVANPYKHLSDRIENLEMQLEIVTETLKELTRERNKNDL